MSSQDPEALELFDRDLLRADDAPGPSPRFVAQLRTTLRQEARRIEATGHPRIGPVVPTSRSIAEQRRSPIRLRGAHLMLNHAAAIGLIVVVLIVSVTALNGRGGPRTPPVIPAGSAATPSALAAVTTASSDPARTNVQPGPGLTSIPKISQQANTAGQSMVLADGMLVVAGPTKVTALDAATLRELWSVTPSPGAYSPPTVAGGRIYLTYARNTEAGGGKASENQLVTLSLQDGRELWRVDGAGAYPASPIVDGDVVYALGVADGRKRIGAYQAGNGQLIWQSDRAPYAWCCPAFGIALSDGLLAVSDAKTLSVYDTVSGALQWSRTPEAGDSIGLPMIVGDRVVVNSADEPTGDPVTPVTSGATTAYDLRTGDIRWSNPSARAYWAPLAAAPAGILYAGPWAGEEAGRLALISADTGDTVWSTPLPRVPGDVQMYIGLPSNVAPAIVGDTAYIAAGTLPNGGATSQSSLIAVVDLPTGTVRWMAQFDGGVTSTPIVAGGRVFALTVDAGLLVLGDSGQPVSQLDATVDLRSPVLCSAPPSTSPLLGPLPATPSNPGVAAWKEPVRFSQISSGVPSNVDPQIAAQLEQRFQEYRSCSQVDPYGSVFGFFSTDFYVRLLALDETVYNSKAQPWAIWMAPMVEFLWLDKSSLQMLPDGRIGSLIDSPSQNIYVWWVQEDGEWKIDEYHRVEADPVDPNAPTPAPSLDPAGTPYG